MNRRRAFTVTLTTAALLATAISPALAGPQRDSVREAADDLVAAGFPAVVVHTRDGARERRVTAGVADVSTGEPARARHRFRIASNTKAFTATVLLQLVGAGRVSLSDTLAEVLPGVVHGNGYDPERITVRQLLDHSSGIHDPLDPHFFDPYLVDHDRGYVYTRPLNLRRTSFPVTDPPIHGAHLHGYDLGGQDMSVFSPSYDWTAGAMVSTVDDLADFHRALFDGRLLAPAQQRQLREVGPGGHYALGVETGPLRCSGGTRTIWGNTGAGPAYFSVSMTTEDGERQVVLVATTFDLAAELREEPALPADPMPALMAALCG
jgi:D-alanyl-D-alanine carboxypeptidase